MTNLSVRVLELAKAKFSIEEIEFIQENNFNDEDIIDVVVKAVFYETSIMNCLWTKKDSKDVLRDIYNSLMF